VSTIRIEVRHADGRTDVATVEGERALIGHGAHCDVRLPIDQAAAEHIAVEVVGGTVRVETKAFEPEATVNGMSFTTMPIGPEMPIKIGTTRIYIALMDLDQKRLGPVAQGKAEESGSPLIRIAAIIGVAAAVYVFLPTEEVNPPAPVDVPKLFATTAAKCEQQAPDQARALAGSLMDNANTERERSPFVGRDGLKAVRDYEQAADCFSVGGVPNRAADAKKVATDLRDSITLDFRARRIRLEHMLQVQDYELAIRDVAVLRELTRGKQGPWISWLASTDQMLKQRVSGK
jgi:hypothetical protein